MSSTELTDIFSESLFITHAGAEKYNGCRGKTVGGSWRP